MSQHNALRVRRPVAPEEQSVDRLPLAGNDRYGLEHRILGKLKGMKRFLMRELFEFFRGKADCFPSNDALAELMGLKARMVQYHLRAIEEDELIKSIRDTSIKSQRRIVLLDHPRALWVLKELRALPSWMERIAEREAKGVQPTAPLEAVGGATHCMGGDAISDTGGVQPIASESSSEKPRNRNRVFPALRGMNPGGKP